MLETSRRTRVWLGVFAVGILALSLTCLRAAELALPACVALYAASFAVTVMGGIQAGMGLERNARGRL